MTDQFFKIGPAFEHKDALSISTTIMLAGCVSSQILLLLMVVIIYDQDVLVIVRTLTTGQGLLDIVIGLGFVYISFSGLVVFTAVTYYAMVYATAVSQWLAHIR